MSPEQRAADLYELWSKRWNDDWCLNPDEFDALVAAIRAAEDEAHESSAQCVDAAIKAIEARPPETDSVKAAMTMLAIGVLRQAAAGIRSLKSKPPEGK